MPVVHACVVDGCETLTMGRYCLQCEEARAGEFKAMELAVRFPEGLEPSLQASRDDSGDLEAAL